MHEGAVGETMQARCGIDASDPELAKIALADTPVAVGIFNPRKTVSWASCRARRAPNSPWPS
jgi:hypothetical protein